MQNSADQHSRRGFELTPRRYELLLFVVCASATLLISSQVLGARLFLIYLYGWNRVTDEGLRIVSMPKGDPWLVSNGEFISEGKFVHFLIGVGCWLLLMLLSFPWLRLLLPRKESTHA